MEQVNIRIPEGYVIDQKESNLEEGKIVFKKKEKPSWRESNPQITGYYVGSFSRIGELYNPSPMFMSNENVFATEKQAKSMLAMAQLSQIIANDERFGGFVTDEEWNDGKIIKHAIIRAEGRIIKESYYTYYTFLAFHTQEQRNLFLTENMDLVKQYYMLD